MSIQKSAKRALVVLVAMTAFNGYSQSTVTFNVDGAKTVVPPGIYGVLMERLGRLWSGNGGSGIFVGTSSSIKNTDGMRDDIIAGFKECGVAAAEWPGGCAANGYNWSANKRPGNDVGVDRFIKFCNLTGAEAIIVGSGTSSSGSSNLAFAQYVIDSLKYPLRYFKIGNEVWGCGGSQNVNGYSSNYSANYDKMKDYVTAKNLKLIASIQYGGDQTWMNSLLSSLSGKVDGFEIHQYMYHPDDYSSTNPTNNQYWDIVKSAYKGIGDNCKNMTNNLNSKDPSNKIKLIFDEWGDWFQDVGDGWEQRITLLDALSTGQHLHAFMESSSRVEVAGLAQAVNVIHALMNINTSGVMVKTPAFYVFKMFIPHHTNEAKQVPISAQSWKNTNNVQAVTSFASVDKSGIVNISFVNVDMSATQAVTVSLTSSAPSYTVLSADVVTGDAINSFNDYGKSEVVNMKTLAASSYSLSGKSLSVTLPSKSVAMIRLAPPGVSSVKPVISNNIGANKFSIATGADKSIRISSLAGIETPVTISLYGIDGRTLVDRVSKTFSSNNTTCVLGKNLETKGAYLVKIKGDNINLTKQIIVSR